VPRPRTRPFDHSASFCHISQLAGASRVAPNYTARMALKMMQASRWREDDSLSRLLLFKGVSREPIGEYLDRCNEWVVSEGEVLISPDRPNVHILLILSGRLGVHLDSPESPPIAILGEGDCAGEMSIIDSERPSAYVTAVEETRLLAIEQETLWDLVHASNGIARNLLLILSGRIRHDNALLLDSLQERRKYEHLATVDALTGLHNRLWLNSMFARELTRSQRGDDPLCLVMVDVDHFKEFNDQHGHLAGDELLCTMADVLRAEVRPHDMVARFGGEEFALLLPGTALEEARGIAERIRAQAAQAPLPIENSSDAAPVTVSVGIAAAKVDDTLQSLLARADEALYQAKRNGRNCVIG